MTVEYADEVLDKINKAEGDKKLELLKQYGTQSPFNYILSLNFDSRVQIDLPEGMPPYKRDESMNPDFFKTTLSREISRMGSLIKGRTMGMPKIKREHIFIQILEGIPPKEADVLVFAKDKALEELYPTITYDLVHSVFPNYCNKAA
jgi:hypothetical protein